MGEKQHVRRSGQAPLMFEGSVRRETSGRTGTYASSLCVLREANRYHNLAVYDVSDGGYVATIEYHTQWQGETNHYSAAYCETPGDVAQFFARYDPADNVVGFPPGEQFAEKQRRLLADIAARYKAQVTHLLDDELFAVAADSVDDYLQRRRDARDLERYRDLVRDALDRLHFTRGEAALICDANNGLGSFDLHDRHQQTEWKWWRSNVVDAIRLNQLDEKWGVATDALLTKLNSLSLTELAAVADAVEKFWDQCHKPTDVLLTELRLCKGGTE